MMTKLSDLSTNHPLYAFVVFNLGMIMGIGRTSLGNLVRLGSRVRSRHWSSYNTPGGNENSRLGGLSPCSVAGLAMKIRTRPNGGVWIPPCDRLLVGERSGTTQFPRTCRNAFIVTPRKLLILGLRGSVKKIGKYLGLVEA